MRCALSAVVLVLVSACAPAAPVRPSRPRPSDAAEASDAAAAEPGDAVPMPGAAPTAHEQHAPKGPYRVTASASASDTGATNREDVTVSWTIEGGPRGKDGEPRVRITVEWTDLPKPGRKRSAPPSSQRFPPDADLCAAPPLESSVSFPMQTKRNALVRVEVSACRDGTIAAETRAEATTRVAWVSPYVDAIDVPSILKAGTTSQGTITFRGIDGPNAAGAPPKVTVTSSNPGVTITKQPAVAASSTFEISVKPAVTGDVKLTAQHVNTDGQGRILGAISKATTVSVRAP